MQFRKNIYIDYINFKKIIAKILWSKLFLEIVVMSETTFVTIWREYIFSISLHSHQPSTLFFGLHLLHAAGNKINYISSNIIHQSEQYVASSGYTHIVLYLSTLSVCRSGLTWGLGPSSQCTRQSRADQLTGSIVAMTLTILIMCIVTCTSISSV